MGLLDSHFEDEHIITALPNETASKAIDDAPVIKISTCKFLS